MTTLMRDHDHGEPTKTRGRLKIGDDWNAITIIALSQSSPLKAIAELVENSIDAKAHTITITRNREHGRHFLAIRDDGEGVLLDGEGKPDFPYVASNSGGIVGCGRRADPRASGTRGRVSAGFGFVSVRPEGACHQRRRVPPRELSIDLVADERLGRVTGGAGAS